MRSMTKNGRLAASKPPSNTVMMLGWPGELAERDALALEAGPDLLVGDLGVDHLHGDVAAEGRLLRLVDGPEAALPDLLRMVETVDSEIDGPRGLVGHHCPRLVGWQPTSVRARPVLSSVRKVWG